jgi:hypothetical protein
MCNQWVRMALADVLCENCVRSVWVLCGRSVGLCGCCVCGKLAPVAGGSTVLNTRLPETKLKLYRTHNDRGFE